MGKRRKGRLGQHMRVKPHCYAGAVIGGCSEKLSEEHPVSESLQRGKKIIVDVKRSARGQNQHSYWPWSTPYTGGTRHEVSMKQASAQILCETHNGQLSRADQAAKAFQDAILEMDESRQSTIIRLPKTFTIDGYQFGRWLCKSYCGQVALRNRPPYPDFVRYAFERPTQERIYFLVPIWGGPVGTPIAEVPSEPPMTKTGKAFYFGFWRIPFIVSVFPLGAPELIETVNAFPSHAQWLERLTELPSSSDWARIIFDWSNEPRA